MLTLLLLTLTGTWLASAALTYREAHRGIDALLDERDAPFDFRTRRLSE